MHQSQRKVGLPLALVHQRNYTIFMNSRTAIRIINEAAEAENVRFGIHVVGRMSERNLTELDIINALACADSCTSQGYDVWSVDCEDLEGEDLEVIVEILEENGLYVMTVKRW